MVRNTKGLKIFLEKKATTPTALALTAVTAAKPAQATAAATTGLVKGLPVTISGTGLASLDGKTFIVGNLTGTTFDLLGSDATAEAGDATAGAADYLTLTDLEQLCVAEISVNGETPSTVSVATFCDPSASVAGSSAGAGTIDFVGFMDAVDKGYQLLLTAEADGASRKLYIEFPGAPAAGYLLGVGTISSMLLTDIPLDGAVKYGATMTLSSKPVHIF